MLTRNYKKKIAQLLPISVLLILAACDFGASKNAEEHMALAREFIANEDFKSGMLELKNALQLESNLPEARWLLGTIYLRQGNGTAAYKEISQAQTLGYNNPEMNNLLLQSMLLQGKHQEILDQTYSDDELSINTLLIRGDAYLGLRQFEEAKSVFEEILEKENNSIKARNGAGQS